MVEVVPKMTVGVLVGVIHDAVIVGFPEGEAEIS
jgi:hypothetical protein